MLAITEASAYAVFIMSMPGLEGEYIHHWPLHSIEALQARLGLRRIGQALLAFPRHNARLSVEEFNETSRNPKHHVLGYAALTDGVAILYTTPEGSVDRSHRFIFPDEGEAVSYHREPVNPPPAGWEDINIDLQGYYELSTRRVVTTQIDWLKTAVSRQAARGFSGSL